MPLQVDCPNWAKAGWWWTVADVWGCMATNARACLMQLAGMAAVMWQRVRMCLVLTRGTANSVN